MCCAHQARVLVVAIPLHEEREGAVGKRQVESGGSPGQQLTVRPLPPAMLDTDSEAGCDRVDVIGPQRPSHKTVAISRGAHKSAPVVVALRFLR